MAICFPRISRTACGDSFNTSRPPKRISPETIFPGGSGISRMSDRFATDLPEPDSPTIPNVSPRFSSKLTPSTAFTTPSSVAKYVRRSLTSSRLPFVLVSGILVAITPPLSTTPRGLPARGLRLQVVLTSSFPAYCLLPSAYCLLLFHLRIQCITQTVPKKIQREQHQRHRHSWKDQLPGKNRQRLRAVRGQTPPGHARRPYPETEERKKRLA